MKLKYKLKSLEGVDENIAKLYKKEGEEYILSLEGLDIPDVEGLKSALDKERTRAGDAEKALKDAEKARKDEADAAARAAGDIEAVEKNLREQFEGEISKRDKIIEARDGQLKNLLIRDEANRIASDLAVDTDSVEVLSEFVRNRLSVEEKDGEFSTVIIDADRKPTGLKVEEFTGQLKTNKSLARLLKASNGTGGGAANAAGAGSPNPKTASRSDFDSWTPEHQSKFSVEGGTLTDD